MRTFIRARCGYWDTTRYPYGGDFHRAGVDGVEVTVLRSFAVGYGAKHAGEDEVRIVATGNTAVVRREYLEVRP